MMDAEQAANQMREYAYAPKTFLDWLVTQNSYEAGWLACPRGTWLIWVLKFVPAVVMRDKTQQGLMLCVCDIIRQLALPHVIEGEMRPMRAVDLAEAFARGESITPETLWDAARDVRASAKHMGNDSASKAAAHSADTVACAAACSTGALGAAAHCAIEAAIKATEQQLGAEAEAEAEKRCADIVRKYYPTAPSLDE